ncbi:hypothetical protein VTO73DRAFT_10837 [Trametes versicolor]
MSPPTSHFYLFPHNPRLPDNRLRRVAQGFPDEGYGVRYTHPSRTAITAVTNTVYKLGVPALFPILPQLLAPDNGGLYHNALLETTTDPCALLIWEELDIASRVAHHFARHVVHFKIFTEAPHSAAHLAFVLLRLVEATSTSSHVVKMKDLSYAITPTTVYGSAYFTGFERAYAYASAFAVANPYFQFAPSTDKQLPLSTWPESRHDLAHSDIVRRCYAAIRSLQQV